MARLVGGVERIADTLVDIKLDDITKDCQDWALRPEFNQQIPPGRKTFF
jgi:hypothetical protein